MITTRYITENDRTLLSTSLALDEYHKDTEVDFFYEPDTVCSVYEDEKGPILFLRGKAIVHEGIGVIQLDIQYINNNDGKRNLKAMMQGFPELENRAKANGFSGFFFVSNVPVLKSFCIKRLGFEDYGYDCLVKSLIEVK
jgi:hypothetical protein